MADDKKLIKAPRFKAAIDKRQIFITPCIGYINERDYYGYPVVAIAFAWLCFRFKVELFVRRYR